MTENNQTDLAAALAKVTAAADAGDTDAQAVLDALTEAADALPDPKPTGSEQGRAEARRRFGNGSAA